jgi:argininosuccinate synthase
MGKTTKTRNARKVVLAYSGGLDTSVIIKWLIDRYDYQVIAFIADLGQGEDVKAIRRKALRTGAVKAIVRDCRKEFAERYVLPALQAGAVYERKYLLATALGRPLIAEHLVSIAREEGAEAVAHGSTGKGNDQVRFDVSVMALDPDLKIIAPVREWELTSRDDEIAYARKHGIPVPVTRDKPYSIDRNLWGTSIECGVLEDPWTAPPDDIFAAVTLPHLAPDRPREIEIGFTKGVPSSLNGKRLALVSLIEEVNRLGGKHGIGISDMVENRLVGIKSREVYEAPGATVLHTAHRELESLVLDRETMHFKEMLVTKYAELVYYGWWFSPLREALDAFVASTQRSVTGKVRLRLYKGTCHAVGRKSPHSLYDLGLATYDKGDTFDHRAGEAFTRIWGLPLMTRAKSGKGKKK